MKIFSSLFCLYESLIINTLFLKLLVYRLILYKLSNFYQDVFDHD
jgi:hypothetical protein